MISNLFFMGVGLFIGWHFPVPPWFEPMKDKLGNAFAALLDKFTTNGND